MNFSKFFAAALITGTTVFAGSAAFAEDHEVPKPKCDCATVTSMVTDGKKMASSVATGAGSAASFASITDKAIQAGGAATSGLKDVKVKLDGADIITSVD